MMDIEKDLEKLSRETRDLICLFIGKQNKATSWIHEYVHYAKGILNQNSIIEINGIPETPKRASRGSLPKPVRVLSDTGGITIVLTPPPSTPKWSKGRSLKSRGDTNRNASASESDSSCSEEKNNCEEMQNEAAQLQNENNDLLCIDENDSQGDKTYFVSPVKPAPKATPNIKKGSARKSLKSARSNQPGSCKVLASTKASKHRNSLNRSIVSSCTKPTTGRSRIQRQTREKQEQKEEEALAKKQALLKMRVEEQKRKREMKMERNLRARQQIEQQTEERLKKMSMLHKEEKDTEKRKNAPKNKKRKQTESSDSEKPSAPPATKVIKMIASTKSAVTRMNSAPPKNHPVNRGTLKIECGSAVKVEPASSSKINPAGVIKVDLASIKKVYTPIIKKVDPSSITTVETVNSSKAVALGCVSKVDDTTFASKTDLGTAIKKEHVNPVTPQKSAETVKVLNSTYVSENKENPGSYAMTPSTQEMSYSNYDMSELRPSDDDDDDVDTSKPVPSWALGIRLKEALIKQHFHPPDLRRLFPPIDIDVDEAFGMKKKKIHRTSSAVWTSTPLRPY